MIGRRQFLSLLGGAVAAPVVGVPSVHAAARAIPIHAAPPFAELVGRDQYIRLLLDFGVGPLPIWTRIFPRPA